MSEDQFENFGDVRDGLRRKQRIVVYCIDQLEKEWGDRNAPTAMLQGRVLDYVDMSEQELQQILQGMTGFKV